MGDNNNLTDPKVWLAARRAGDTVPPPSVPINPTALMSSLPGDVRGKVFDAYLNASSPQDFTARLNGVAVDPQLRDQLLGLKFSHNAPPSFAYRPAGVGGAQTAEVPGASRELIDFPANVGLGALKRLGQTFFGTSAGNDPDNIGAQAALARQGIAPTPENLARFQKQKEQFQSDLQPTNATQTAGGMAEQMAEMYLTGGPLKEGAEALLSRFAAPRLLTPAVTGTIDAANANANAKLHGEKGDAAPILAASLAGAYGSALRWNALRRIFAAAAAGSTASAFNQGMDRIEGSPDAVHDPAQFISNLLKQGGIQGLIEAAGIGAAAPFTRAAGGSPRMQYKPGMDLPESQRVADNQRISKLNDELGLGLTNAEITGSPVAGFFQDVSNRSLLGRFPAQAAIQNTNDALNQHIDEVLDRISNSTASPTATGSELYNGLTRAHDMFKRGASLEINKLNNDAGNLGVTVDMIGPQKLAVGDLQAYAKLQKYLFDNPLAQLSPDEKLTLNGVLRTGGQTTLPFDVAKTLQERLGRLMDTPEIMQSPDRAFMSRYYGALQDAIKQGLGDKSPVLQLRYEKWLKDYASGANLFENDPLKQLVDIGRNQPEELAKRIGLDDTSKVKSIKNALFNYNQYATTPADRQLNLAAWDRFQRQYTQNLLGAPNGIESFDIQGLPDRLKSVSSETLNAVYSGNRAALQNLRDLADVVERLRREGQPQFFQLNRALWTAAEVATGGLGSLTGFATGHPGVGAGLLMGTTAFEGLPYAISKVVYSKRATALMVKGIGGLMQENQTPFLGPVIRGTGKAVSASAPYYGTATADIIRALQMADQEDEQRRKQQAPQPDQTASSVP